MRFANARMRFRMRLCVAKRFPAWMGRLITLPARAFLQRFCRTMRRADMFRSSRRSNRFTTISTTYAIAIPTSRSQHIRYCIKRLPMHSIRRVAPRDYYAMGPAGDDGGYLRWLVTRSQDGIRAIDGYEKLLPHFREAAGLYAEMQTYKHYPAGEREARAYCLVRAARARVESGVARVCVCGGIAVSGVCTAV